jgi:hypothetical protein
VKIDNLSRTGFENSLRDCHSSHKKLEKNNLTPTRRIRKKAEGIVDDDGKMRMMMREEKEES